MEDEYFFEKNECFVPSSFEQFINILRKEKQNFSIEKIELEDWRRIRWYPFEDVNKAILLYFDGDGEFREIQKR